MAEENQKKWTDFAVGRVSTRSGWTNPDCVPLGSVAHVTHVRAAVEIVRGNSLNPGLIFDRSKLNTSRILVSWLSPNSWTNAGGFRYGNVAFDFAWESLVEGLNAYWVGTMDYKPIACRILLTDQDRESELLPYDPKRGDGPWWFDNATKQHYWNGDLCMEFMVERSLDLDDAEAIRFVRHHDLRCCIDPNGCADRGDRDVEGGARFITACCGQKLELPARLFTRKKNGDSRPNNELNIAWDGVYDLVRKSPAKYTGHLRDDEKRLELARAAMAAFGRRDDVGAATLLGFFESRTAALDVFADVIERDLGLPETLDRSGA